MSNEKHFRKADRIIERTAIRISNELSRMVADLPVEVASTMAFAQVILALADLKPMLMRYLMEEMDIRELYWAAVARRPATPHRDPVV